MDRNELKTKALHEFNTDVGREKKSIDIDQCGNVV